MSLENVLMETRLLDTYGAMLTDRQFSVLSCYYYDNLTLSEIADNMGVSRQAVKDTIDKSLKILENFESKLHFVSKCDYAVATLETVSENGFDKGKIASVIEKLKE